VVWDSTAQYDVRSTPTWSFDGEPVSSLQYHPPKINIQAGLDLKVWLIPQVRFSATKMLEMTAGMEPYVQLLTKYQYPAFPPISNPNGGSDPASLVSFGVCSKSHFIRAQINAGIERMLLDLNVDVQFLPGTPLKWQKNIELPIMQYLVLASGCLVNPGQVSSIGLDLQTNRRDLAVTGSNDIRDLEYMVYVMRRDLAAAVDIEPTRVIVTSMVPSADKTHAEVDIVSETDVAEIEDQLSSQEAAAKLLEMIRDGDEAITEGEISQFIVSAVDKGTVDPDNDNRPQPSPAQLSSWALIMLGFASGTVMTLLVIAAVVGVRRRRAAKQLKARAPAAEADSPAVYVQLGDR